MSKPKINDRKLLQLIDKKNMSQSAAAKELGVSRQAVSKRLQDIRGQTTKAVVTKKIAAVVDQKIDALAQLQTINKHANWLLDNVMKWIKGDKTAIQVLEKNTRLVNVGTKEDPEYVTEYKFKDPHEIALRSMQEIRGQLKTQLDIFQALFSLQAAADFETAVLETIAEVDSNVRNEIIRKLNAKRNVRSVVKFH